MASDEKYLELLKRKVAKIEGMEGGRSPPPPPPPPSTGEPGVAPEGVGGSPEASLEAVILWHRPVLWIRQDDFERFTFTDPNDRSSPEILDLLEKRRSVLAPTIRSIGRIELKNNAQYEWVGTGWVLDSELGSDIVVTNAHVAREFAQRSGAGFVFRRGTIDFGLPQAGRIDFREEIDDSAPREFAVSEVIWISDDEIIDVALLRVVVKSGNDRLSGPIRLATETPIEGRNVAVIGYPGDDSKSYDAEKFVKLFGRTFGKKRLAPGRLMARHQWGLTHDCSTLPGNSGSVVIDIETGRAVGLHYSGSMFRANYAVPAGELARVIRERPWRAELSTSRPALADPAAPAMPSIQAAPSIVQTGGEAGGAFTVVVPIEISVRVGAARASATGYQQVAATDGSRPAAGAPAITSAEAAAESVRKHLAGNAAILSVKADYLFRDGLITDDIGVIVGVRPDASLDPTTHGLPPQFNGVPIAVEHADPETVVAELLAVKREAFGGRRAEYDRDLTKPQFSLAPVTDNMKITLHVSPEAGWPVLKHFFAMKSVNQLTIGMYHMTAPHVVKAIQDIAGRDDTRITLTLDRQRGDADVPDDIGGETKKDDVAESKTLAKLKSIARRRFKWAPASLGGSGLFPMAYHIKVAVWSRRSGSTVSDKAFWLSSGNWQSSNQAPLDIAVSAVDSLTWEDVRDYNREWHAVVEHEGLAKTFRHHLEADYEDNEKATRSEAIVPEAPHLLVPLERPPARPQQFEVFAPEIIEGRVKVQPLLTPDNYPEVIAELIEGARDRVLIENQSFSLWSKIEDTPEHFLRIARAVRDKQKDGLDVRIIFRNIKGSEKETIRRLKKFKIKTGRDHLRYFGTCHTKGIVIDDDIAILGSQNWTAAGSGPNRDASLVIWHRKANAYFAKLFEYDWEQIASTGTRSESAQPIRIVPAGVEAPVPSGYRRMSIDEYLGET